MSAIKVLRSNDAIELATAYVEFTKKFVLTRSDSKGF